MLDASSYASSPISGTEMFVSGGAHHSLRNSAKRFTYLGKEKAKTTVADLGFASVAILGIYTSSGKENPRMEHLARISHLAALGDHLARSVLCGLAVTSRMCIRIPSHEGKIRMYISHASK